MKLKYRHQVIDGKPRIRVSVMQSDDTISATPGRLNWFVDVSRWPEYQKSLTKAGYKTEKDRKACLNT